MRLPSINVAKLNIYLFPCSGAEDMEDMSVPSDMPPLAEDGETSAHSRNNSDEYLDVPASPNNMPLLHNDDDSAVLSNHDSQPPGEGMPVRQSMPSPGESTSLMRVETNRTTTSSEESVDPRGNTPAYFEVVDLTYEQPEVASPPVPQASSAVPEPATNRRSTFLSLFSSRGNSNHRASVVDNARAPSHIRNDSLMSMSSQGHDPSTGLPRVTTSSHRPSQSGSGSLLSISNLRRKKSTNTLNSVGNLASASTLSVNSISAPLTHTLGE